MTATYSGAPWPVYDDEQIEAVARVLRSGKVNYWTGSEGRDFEREFAEFTGLAKAVFVANGTVALELALRALDLPPGSEVITTPRTFVASSSAIVSVGLRPVFADIDPESGNITPDSIREVMTESTSAVLVVHLGGWPAAMVEIQELCHQSGIALVEDCSQAHGAKIGDRHVGSFSDVAAWSFCQDKIITTGGEGGMVATNRDDLWRRIWSYKDHGKSWEAVYERQHPPGFRWLHEDFGTNARGTEMQAALGRIQYQRLPDWHAERTRNAGALVEALRGVPALRIPLPNPGETHAYYRLNAYLDLSRLHENWTRDRVIGEVAGRHEVPIFSGSCSEIYREGAFKKNGLMPDEPLPNAARMTDESLAFLVHPGLSTRDMGTVGMAVADVLAEAVKKESS